MRVIKHVFAAVDQNLDLVPEVRHSNIQMALYDDRRGAEGDMGRRREVQTAHNIEAAVSRQNDR